MLPVPFKTDTVHGGFSEAHGTIRVDGEQVVVEVQVKTLGMISGAARSFRFDVTDLDTVEHSRGLLRDRLTLRTRPMHHATQMPGGAEGRFQVTVRRRDRRALDAFLDRIDLWIV